MTAPPRRPRSYEDIDAHGIWWWVTWDWGTGPKKTPVQVAYQMSPMVFVDPNPDKDGRDRCSRLDTYTDGRWHGPCLVSPTLGDSTDDGRDEKRDARTKELREKFRSAADELHRTSGKVAKISAELTDLVCTAPTCQD